MALSVLCKCILQMRMRSHPVGLDVWFLVGPMVYFHTSCVWTAKALARLRGCAGSPEPSLVAFVISTIISWAGSLLVSVAELLYHAKLILKQAWSKLNKSVSLKSYHNGPNFSDRQVWANRGRSSLIRVYTVCHSICIFCPYYSVVNRAMS